MNLEKLAQSTAPMIKEIVKSIKKSHDKGYNFILWDPQNGWEQDTKKALRDNNFKIKGEFWGGDIRIEWDNE